MCRDKYSFSPNLEFLKKLVNELFYLYYVLKLVVDRVVLIA